MYVHDSDAFVMLLCAILGIIHFVSLFLYGYLFHAKLLKNNSTIKYWSVFKEEQNANDLMTMTIMTMTIIDSQYATKKARKEQKNLSQAASVSDFLFIFASEYVFSCLITATQGKRNIWHGILQKQTSAKQMHTAKFNHRVADIFYGIN